MKKRKTVRLGHRRIKRVVHKMPDDTAHVIYNYEKHAVVWQPDDGEWVSVLTLEQEKSERGTKQEAALPATSARYYRFPDGKLYCAVSQRAHRNIAIVQCVSMEALPQFEISLDAAWAHLRDTYK